MRNGFNRPAVLGLLEAALDADGRPIAWKHRIVGPDHMAHQLPRLIPISLPYGIPRTLRNTAGALANLILPRVVTGKKAIEGAAPLSYALANVAVEFVHDDPGIPLGFWRSVAFSQNVFFVESFIDEIAAAVGRDPLERSRGQSKAGYRSDHRRNRLRTHGGAEKPDHRYEWTSGPGQLRRLSVASDA